MSNGVLQKLLWHVKQTFRTTFNLGSKKTSLKGLMTGGESKKISQPAARPLEGCLESRWLSENELIELALSYCSLIKNTPETNAFYRAVFAAIPEKPISIRTHGDILSLEEKRDMGISGKVKISRQFADTLTDSGHDEPIVAAYEIYRIFNSLRYSQSNLRKYYELFSDDDIVEISRSNMLAGPCDSILALPERLPLADAPIFPLHGCAHPDQCACLTRIIPSFMVNYE